MSTVNPIEARRQREAARLGSTGAAVGIAIGLGLIVLGGALEVRALFGFAEFQGDGQPNDPPLAIFGMIVGLPTLLVGFFIHVGASRRFTGRLLSSPGVGPLTMLVFGLALGAWWGVVSVPNSRTFWLIPAALTVLAASMLIVGVRTRMRRRNRSEALAELLSRGRTVSGVIAEIPEIDPSSGGLIGNVTVSFVDSAGVARWVTKTGQWKSSDLPKTGDPASVLFDPARPDDTSSIWVGPAGSATVADFTRWHA